MIKLEDDTLKVVTGMTSLVLTLVRHMMMIRLRQAADTDVTILACFLRKSEPLPYITDTKDSL